MAIEISTGKWSAQTTHGSALFKIKADGIHVQEVTNIDGRLVIHNEKILSFDQVLDLAVGQKRLVP